MDRIPVIIERLEHLRSGQEETRKLITAEINDLKLDHITDIRKNICRLWMAVDELRGVKNRALGMFGAIHIIAGMFGVATGIVATFVVKLLHG